jgi:hypothetical protein
VAVRAGDDERQARAGAVHRHGDDALTQTIAVTISGVKNFCGLVVAALASTSEFRLSRVIVWGVLVGVALPLVAGKGLPEIVVTAPLGAISAMASIAIVRPITTAHRQDRPSLP